MFKIKYVLINLFLALGPATACALAQERVSTPYFITYDHYMEEPGALEIGIAPVLGRAHEINTFWGNWIEFEYGARKWWTTEFYINWQHTQHEGSLFTGFRF